MANLKEVRNRIVSVSSTQQITSAMKMVSAAKLRRAQDAVTQMRPYASKLKEILENLSASLDSSEGVYSKQREVKNVLLVVITSNRGLCGGFNANVIKAANRLAREQYKGCKVSVLTVGKKGGDFFKKTDYSIMGSDMPRGLNELFDKLTFANVAPVAEKVMEAFANGQFDKVELVYNQFKNAAVQVTTVEQFLPVAPPAATDASKSADYIFEPNKQYIVEDLIPRSLKTQFFKALLDSLAAEHGARMTAMHKATDNAGALIKELKLTYNKARQAAITNEILEIVGGAEALNG
ncbi:MAG: ATP synthase F1 subunit gamma [Bacteroidetes bacterium]|nr:ATP synthase F1 subunit gamma [Bacteroidia bacterium]MBN8695110.1 ATP synthase F1 subunit gamma [Bacteroidota bacterium]MCK6650165.1 ATP synthase F1 subunit gamma [Bacteroidia bacterium]